MAAIKEKMQWPPMGILEWKMSEHSAWYTGDAEILANYYSLYSNVNNLGLSYPLHNENFWGRQLKNQGEIFAHVNVAGDIAETSANLLFSESPIIRIAQAQKEGISRYKGTQEVLDKMLMDSSVNFFRKIIEAAESASAMGGVYIKICWDDELSEFPLPVVMQADRAIPEFKFGVLCAVTFWTEYKASSNESDKVYRLLERYEFGKIINTLYFGTGSNLGYVVDLGAIDETKELIAEVVTPLNELLAVYVPNMLPNRLNRNSYIGRSDYSGIEGMMDSLDEIYSNWVRNIVLAQPRVIVPESYLAKKDGKKHYNYDEMIYVQMDIDPISEGSGSRVTLQQFEIKADQYEKSALNFLERIVTSAGYSPQSFGLNIQGSAESGTALNIRERKSIATRNKKQNYWGSALKQIIYLMLVIYKTNLKGKVELDSEVNISFSDGLTNSLSEVSSAVKMISDAIAASTETKVRLIHPEWDEEQIKKEAEAINKENGIGEMSNPDGMNLDTFELDEEKKDAEAKSKANKGTKSVGEK